ncbi:hypothetical protein H8K35_07830 [Undibacterium sp. LX40W]|uniref:Uncharacterized protein n=1 Tax=Undibacterium nitidum TaxID=2762298 RepID=A0A923KTW6_9BURK|nr:MULTISPECIES: hypothetical protein [Undibacterium]MBC3881657.1 hypothetical protein [Undibacterium nitidum]MBC3891560.1 hypothetical protein [Undibacterium sp. LX40W]
MSWKVLSTIEPIISTSDAYFYLCLSIAFVAFSVLEANFCTLLAGAFFLITGLFFLFVVIFPERSKRGIRILDDAFEYAQTFKVQKVMRFQDISMIEASSFESSETGERDIMLKISTENSMVIVFEKDLRRTGLLERLEVFFPIDQMEMERARGFERKWYDFLAVKYFVVFAL